MRRLMILSVLMLAGCAGMPVMEPRPVALVAKTGSSEPVPVRIECRRPLSQEDELARSLAEQLADQGSFYAALAQVEGLPSYMAKVALLRADILRRLDPERARAWYEVLLGTCESGRAEHGLGLLLAGQGRYTEAAERMAVAARLHPADARIRNDYGVALLHLAQDTGARFELRTAHELMPDDLQPQFNLMLLSLLTNDVAEWRQARQRWQPSAATRAELRSVCTRLAQIRSASVPGEPGCRIDPLL